MNQKKQKKKPKIGHQQFEFCEVCRLNHYDGRRHNYFPSHKTNVSSILSRFQSKLSDVKFFLKTPSTILPQHAHQNRLWCIFCNCDILELDSQFACGSAIEHLASEDHWKRVKGFMWKYGGGMDRVDLFRIAEADYAKWEKKCMSLKMEATKTKPAGASNNIHDTHNAESVNNSSKNNCDALNSCIPNYVLPLHSYTNERTPLPSLGLSSSVPETGSSSYNIPGGSQVLDAQCLKNSTGFVDNQHFSNSLANGCSSYGYSKNGSVYSGVRVGNGEISSGLVNLTQISSTSKVVMEGNVHSGAPPPWLDATKGENLNSAWKQEARDHVTSRAGKSKLNPKRVGAAWAERRKLELEMERRGELVNNNFDANWLPSFGRVWQSGTRKESRKEFQMENKATQADGDQSEMLMPVQPYISKRMRKEARDDTLDKHVKDWSIRPRD